MGEMDHCPAYGQWFWVSIRIKSRLIMGVLLYVAVALLVISFQSESNLGLLWGWLFYFSSWTGNFVSIRIKSRLIMGDGSTLWFKTSSKCFNPNQISAYYGGRSLAKLVKCQRWVSIRIKSRLIMGGTSPFRNQRTYTLVSIRIKSRLIMGVSAPCGFLCSR